MKRSEAATMAVKGALNHALTTLPTVPHSLTRPTNISVMITRDCNLRCRMCGIPDTIWPHLTVDQWKGVLDDIAEWAGGYTKIQFSGGEPLIFKGIYELLEHCVNLKLMPGVTTNATVIPEKKADKLMSLGLSNVNVSLDGLGATQDYVRGFNAVNKPMKVWEKTDTGIRNLIAARERHNAKTVVFLKTCLMGINAGEVRELVDHTEEVGADGITFQPLQVREVDGEDTDGLLGEWDQLIEASEQLIEMRQQGRPITNSLEHLKLFRNYFRDPLSGNYPGMQACTIGDSSLEIHSDGRVEFCGDIGIIGNATEIPVSELWRSKQAAEHRDEISACTQGCLQTCYANKSLSQKARMFLKIAK